MADVRRLLSEDGLVDVMCHQLSPLLRAATRVSLVEKLISFLNVSRVTMTDRDRLIKLFCSNDNATSTSYI